MEKSVFHYLFHIVVCHFRADLTQIIARFQQFFFFIHSDTVNVLHHQHLGGRIFPIQHRACDKCHIFVQSRKLFHVRSFCQEVHLILRYYPHFIQHLIHIHQTGHIDWRHQFDSPMQKCDVPGHGLVNALALHFYYYCLTAFQLCFMHLCNGCRTDRIFLNFFKHVLQLRTISMLNDLTDF